jgi:hypothetical protein
MEAESREFDALSASNQALDLEYEKRSAGDAKP